MSASVGDTEFVFGRMSGIARFIYEVMPSYTVAGYVLFALVFLMSAIVYKLGFARKLKAFTNFSHLCLPVYRLSNFNVSWLFPSNRGRPYCGGSYFNHLSSSQDE